MCWVYVFIHKTAGIRRRTSSAKKSSYRRIAAYLLMEAKVSQHKLNAYLLDVVI